MADLFNPDHSDENSTTRTLGVSALFLVTLAAVVFGFFYHHENHAPVELTSVRTLVLPVHTTYTHTGKTAGGPEGGEDTTYVVALLHVRDHSNVPLFIKDVTGSLHLQDGTAAPFTRIKARDLDRLLTIVPTLKPVLAQASNEPLQLEQTIAAGASADGYVLFQFAGPQQVWNTRKDASLTVDFYHQNAVTTTVK